ncbi:MAG: helix-turn-helix domain-containing protein [Treponema sp.]|jgi:transcriptional regulator with XRE-family HTH domain|nr:helix-turn-helix domain-containing protein [Treponema sp.]
MKKRLKLFRKSLGLTQGEFGKKIAMSDVAISHMESGRTALSGQNIKLICLTFGVREEWLREGKGEMMDEGVTLSGRERHLLELFYKLSPKAQQMVIEYTEKLLADEKALRGEEPETEKGERRADTSEKPV